MYQKKSKVKFPQLTTVNRFSFCSIMATLLHLKCFTMEKNPRAVSDAVASNWK